MEYIDTGITRVTLNGIQTTDGIVRGVGIIILATGFKDGFYLRSPTIGKDGDLAQNWRPGEKTWYPVKYLGVMALDVPNYFIVLQVS